MSVVTSNSHKFYTARGAMSASRLVKKKAGVNAADQDGMKPLHRAVLKEDEKLVSLLIKKGADVNAANRYGDTPLLDAVHKGNKDLASFLIKKGADVNAANRYGDTPLIEAARKGDKDLASFLIEKNADVNAADRYGDTPLLWAMGRGYFDLASLLFEKGADVNATNQKGNTPLLLAESKDNKKFATLLLVNAADVNKFTALKQIFAERPNLVDIITDPKRTQPPLHYLCSQIDSTEKLAKLLALIIELKDLGAIPNRLHDEKTALEHLPQIQDSKVAGKIIAALKERGFGNRYSTTECRPAAEMFYTLKCVVDLI